MINSISLMGRLTFEPELKSTPNGTAVVKFQIAVDRNYQKGDEKVTDFIDCVAWRQTAEFVQRNFRTGQLIALTGELQTNNYTDKDGKKRKSVEVVANNVSFCGDKKNAVQGGTKPDINISVDNIEEITDDDDDLPF